MNRTWIRMLAIAAVLCVGAAAAAPVDGARTAAGPKRQQSAAGVATPEIRKPLYGQVEATVLSRGKPVHGALIHFHRSGFGPRIRGMRTGPLGHARGRRKVGTFRVVAWKRGEGRGRATVTIPHGELAEVTVHLVKRRAVRHAYAVVPRKAAKSEPESTRRRALLGTPGFHAGASMHAMR